MRTWHGLRAQVFYLLLHRRWVVVFLIVLANIAAVIVENAPGEGEEFGSDAAREIILWGLILPLICGLLLTAFVRAKAESVIIRSATMRAEQHRIARDLHDSLAQNLGYVCLKLDQLAHADALQELGAIRQELESTHKIANAAYDQVREELVHLYHASSGDLQTALLSQARLIASRAGFQVHFTSDGVPSSVPPDVQEHLYYLLREALTNVGKHAAAKLVRIKLEWATDTLTVTLTDDGCGFEPGTTSPDGHLGLAIMRERAREVNALCTVTSCPGTGTQLTLSLPIAHTREFL